MKSLKILPLVLLLFVVLLAAACSQQATPAQPPTESVSSVPTAELALQTPTEAASPTSEPTLEPTEAPAPTKSADLVDYCLDCHADKQALIDNAKPEEEVISENEGAG